MQTASSIAINFISVCLTMMNKNNSKSVWVSWFRGQTFKEKGFVMKNMRRLFQVFVILILISSTIAYAADMVATYVPNVKQAKTNWCWNASGVPI